MKRLIASFAVLGAMVSPVAAQPAATTNSIGMEFVLIQPGAMQVGVFTPSCPEAPAPGAAPAAPAPPPGITPQPPQPREPRNEWTPADYQACARMTAEEHLDGFRVELPKPFYMGKFEVTQGQWRQVMGENPSTFQRELVGADTADFPMESVSWAEAKAFVAALNRREKTKAYRLPTEFEWEYACRAGGPGQQSWADIRATAVEGGTASGRYGGPKITAYTPPPTTRKVGTKAPNAWGLYDMLGGVWEWVDDPYNGELFADPRPAKRGAEHVLKGGSFTSDVKNAICATHAGGPANRWDVGFRIVRD